jgi:DnaJ-class molecular chaperone
MDYKDYYKILGIAKDSSTDDIKKAFRKLARKYHPDVNPGNKQAEMKFKEINEANEVLTDSEKRRKYDTLGPNWQEQFGPSFSNQRSTYNYRGAPMDFEGNAGFSDFFEALFGRANPGGMGGMGGPGMRGSTSGYRPRIGENIEQPVEVTIREAYTGGTRTFNIQSTEVCTNCKGTGEVGNKPCSVCNGQGFVPRNKRIQIKIPAGVDNGSRIRVAGEGQPAPGGGPRGDLFLVITLRSDPLYERKGDDLFVDIDVDLFTALLGGEAPVPLPDGRKLVLTIPPETQNGRTFRLNNKGMPRLKGEGQGTLFARVRVILPTQLTEEERKLFEQMARNRQSGAEVFS